MKSNPIFFTTLTLAAPLAFLLQASALAQAGPARPAAGVIDVYWQGAPAQAEGTTTSPQPVQDTAATASTPGDNVEFFFPGGNPWEFVAAVEKQYKVDWAKVVDIPNNMQAVHIPRLRMNRQSVESMFPVFRRGGRGGGAGGGFGGGGGGGGGPPNGLAAMPEDRQPLEALITLYNDLSRAKPELGNLMVEGDLAKPSVVIFHSNYANPTPERMKVFALGSIPKDKWEQLAKELNDLFISQFTILRENQGADHVPGGAVIHAQSALLIVSGTESALETAESFVTAWRANYATPVPGAPVAPAAVPSQK